MGPFGVVIHPPVLDDRACLIKAGKPVLVQAFIAHPAVKTLNKRVVAWLAGPDKA